MAISRLATQDAQASSASSPIATTYPGATTAGNLLIAVVSSNANISTLAGWTLMKNGFSNASMRINVYYKAASGSETSVSFSSSGSTFASIDIFEYTGNLNPIVEDGMFTNDGGSSNRTTWPTAPITAAYSSGLILSVIVTNSNDFTTFAWPTSTLVGAHAGGGTGPTIYCGELITTAPSVSRFERPTWANGVTVGTVVCGFGASGGTPGYPTLFNNYQSPKSLNGISVTEKIR